MSVVKRIIWGSESPDYAIGGSMLVDVCLGAYCGFDRRKSVASSLERAQACLLACNADYGKADALIAHLRGIVEEKRKILHLELSVGTWVQMLSFPMSVLTLLISIMNDGASRIVYCFAALVALLIMAYIPVCRRRAEWDKAFREGNLATIELAIDDLLTFKIMHQSKAAN